MKRVTIYDVAKESGVSLATVSRVINGSTVVKEPTRKKFKQLLKKLGYKPNALAQGLALQKNSQYKYWLYLKGALIISDKV